MNRYKVAVVAICLNKNYWPFIGKMIDSARKFLLKGHDVDYLVWGDMDKVEGATLFPTEPMEWPMPTLHRYHLFLQQEEKLKEYDYIFYVDADMLFVSNVGDEILPERGLMAAQHPMYAVSKRFTPPYEPNPTSYAYIPRPGRITIESGKKRFEPVYAAGGFQGGCTEDFIKAMKSMKESIDKDFSENNYIAIWNDETHWNKYLFQNPPSVVLSPSYVYPDSLNKAYYQKVWGRNYVPRLVTITKKFTLSKEGGDNLALTLGRI